MHLEGRVNIKAPRERVFELLTDSQGVSQCFPGIESLEIIAPGRKFLARGAIGLGSVKVKFANEVEWLELDAPNRATMKTHGTAPGSSMDATSEMVLTEGADGSTDMTWKAEVVVLGTIASLAARLMGSVAKKLTAEFFNCVKKRIEG